MAAIATRSSVKAPVQAGRRSVACKASRPVWLPGTPAPAHLKGELPGDYGYDPLGLGQNPERLAWYAESERFHGRLAMTGVAGILAQEIVHPDVFWYTGDAQVKLPFNIFGLLAIELWACHFVEIKRLQDFKNPGSVDQDPIHKQFKLAAHEVGYPGFGPFKPANMAEYKVKEIKNGRLAMLAFIGFVMGAQVNGKGPLHLLADHVSAPLDTTIFSKAVVIPGQAIVPPCAIPESVQYQGITIPTPCFLHALWP